MKFLSLRMCSLSITKKRHAVVSGNAEGWDKKRGHKLEGGIQFGCKHAMISSHLPAYELKDGIILHI